MKFDNSVNQLLGEAVVNETEELTKVNIRWKPWQFRYDILQGAYSMDYKATFYDGSEYFEIYAQDSMDKDSVSTKRQGGGNYIFDYGPKRNSVTATYWNPRHYHALSGLGYCVVHFAQTILPASFEAIRDRGERMALAEIEDVMQQAARRAGYRLKIKSNVFEFRK